jgi:hypothetical protein
MIATLVGLYYLMSPYQNCIRNFEAQGEYDNPDDKLLLRNVAIKYCKGHSW